MNTIVDQLQLVARLPFVAETRLEHNLVLVKLIPLFASALPIYRVNLTFNGDAFIATQVINSFRDHIIQYLTDRGEVKLAQQARAMLNEG